MSRDVENYRAAMRTVILCARLLAPYDLRQLLRDISFAGGVAPIIDPTLWIKKAGKMEEDAQILRAALPLRELAEKLSAVADEINGDLPMRIEGEIRDQDEGDDERET